MRATLVVNCLALISNAALAAEPSLEAGFVPTAQNFKERARQFGGVPAEPFKVCQKPKPSWANKGGGGWSDGDGVGKVLFGAGVISGIHKKSLGLSSAWSRARVALVRAGGTVKVTETSSGNSRSTRVETSTSAAARAEILDCYFGDDDSVYVLVGIVASDLVDLPPGLSKDLAAEVARRSRAATTALESSIANERPPASVTPPPAKGASCSDRPASPQAAQPFDLGMSLIQEQKHQEAIAPLQQAASLEPDLAIVHMYLGICYSRMSDQKNAATEYEAFIKACPGHPMAARVQTLLGESRASKPH
jgi:hypothetical protein